MVITPRRPWRFLFCVLIPAASCLARTDWDPVTPEELKDNTPKIEAGAPAEALFWRIEIDDSYAPRPNLRSEMTGYIRYKIYEPAKVEDITRISSLLDALAARSGKDHGRMDPGEEVDLQARLVLPDGSIKEFGPDAVLERTVSESLRKPSFLARLIGGAEENPTEKFMAVLGIQAGAVLEYKITVKSSGKVFPNFSRGHVLQLEAIPVRSLEYTYHAPRDQDSYAYHTFACHGALGGAEITQNSKKGIVTVTAHGLPSLLSEPYSGTIFDTAFSVFSGWRPHEQAFYGRSGVHREEKIDPKTMGPWSQFSVPQYVVDEDLCAPTRRVKKMVQALTQGMASPLEKAQVIDREVRKVYLHYLTLPAGKRTGTYQVESVDDALDHEGKAVNGWDFLYLAMSMYREAGIEVRTILLPDRRKMLFNPGTVADIFLQDQCVGLHIGDQWYYSFFEGYDSEHPEVVPHNGVLPFNFLPWYFAGQVGLVAKPGPAEFVKIPLPPPEQSMVITKGTFRMNAEGEVEGEYRVRSTGEEAFNNRAWLQDEPPQRQKEVLVKHLGQEAKGSEISVDKIEGVDNPGVPLDVYCKIKLPSSGIPAKDSLLVYPSLLNAGDASPFSAPDRSTPVLFNYPFASVDQLTIEIPGGYEPEGLASPPPVGIAGANFILTYTYDPGPRVLKVRREVVLRNVAFSVASYHDLKAWYEKVADVDHQPVVFRKVSKAGAAGP